MRPGLGLVLVYPFQNILRAHPSPADRERLSFLVRGTERHLQRSTGARKGVSGVTFGEDAAAPNLG